MTEAQELEDALNEYAHKLGKLDDETYKDHAARIREAIIGLEDEIHELKDEINLQVSRRF